MIQLNDFKRQWLTIGPEVLEVVEQTGASGSYILGENVAEFEAALARYWGLGHAVGVASGLDALEISLRTLACGVGDRVLTSPISAFATVLAILKLGAVPVFADCDKYGLIDLEECRTILRQQPQVRYFVPVHLYGHALDMRRLRELRDEFDLKMVEDCAQAIGARDGEMTVGTAGQMAATSFYPTKNLGAMGDGGAILTGDAGLAAKARELRDYGQSAKYRHESIGYNSRLDELQAALLASVGLPRLEAWTERRRAIAARYKKEIRNERILVCGEPEGSHSCWHLFPVLIVSGTKKDFQEHLLRHGVVTGEHYPLALVEQTALKGLGDWERQCGRAKDFCHAEVSLPIHPYLFEDEVDRLIQSCNSWVK